MADELMHTPKMIHYYPFNKLQLSIETSEHVKESTNQNSLKSPNLLGQRIRNSYFRTLDTNVINSPMSPPSLSPIPISWNMNETSLYIK